MFIGRQEVTSHGGRVDLLAIAPDSQTLRLLSPGERVWVKIPKKGYVGVGVVLESVQLAKDFKVETESGEQSALLALKHSERYRLTANDPERTAYFVRV